ncbi:MAG: aminopeptidase P family protein [Bacilli bacterium]|jgi:Xaa-Pro dipeptidase|nr:aminopeptidase P family protein [Bacilli bacterium]
MNDRFNKVIENMKDSNINQFIICDPGSIYYLTNQLYHTGHRMLALLISLDKEPELFIHEMFPTRDLKDIKVNYFKDGDDSLKMLYQALDKTKQVVVDKYFDARYVIGLRNFGLDLPIEVGSYLIDDLRGVKTDKEIELMKNASKINDKVMLELQDYISKATDKITELALEKVLSQLYAKYTDEGYSFNPIIAFGINATDPHHVTDNTVLKKGDCIVIDIGCVKENYCSDMTRTCFYQEVSEFNKNIYNIVKEANEKAMALVKPGIKFSEIDAIARNFITKQGYGEYFNHRLGHFIGTECHEAGDVSGINNNLVKEGNIFSIEPGIYIRDKKIGVRLENLVVVTKDGCESLNKISLDLKIL